MVLVSLPSARQNFEAALNLAQEMKFLTAGDLVVMSAGTLQDVAGSTDLIKVEFVSSVVGRGLSIGSGIVHGRARVAFHHLDVRDFNEGEILEVRLHRFRSLSRPASASAIPPHPHGNDGAILALHHAGSMRP